MHWDDLKMMLASYRLGSASRAAADLGVTVSTVTRRLAQLEQDLGAPLFVRTPEGLRITEAGSALLPYAQGAERAILGAEAAVASLGETPAGEVSVTLPEDVLCSVVLPQLGEFHDAYPEVRVRWLVTPRLFDLARREVDVAIRVRVPEHPMDDVLARRIRQVPVAAYGTEGYLDTLSGPVEDVASHRWVTMVYSSPFEERHDLSVVHAVDSTVALRLAAACGLGAAILPVVFAELTPGLVPIPLSVPMPDPLEIYALTHRAVRHRPAVAALWDFLIESVGDDPDRDDVAFLDDLHRRFFRDG